MSDIATRLRAASADERLSTGMLYREAADEIERLTSELAHVARSLAWQQDERRKAEAERDEARAELAAQMRVLPKKETL